MQVVDQQEGELARAAQHVEDREQFGSHCQRVDALGQLVAQRGWGCYSEAAGRRGDLGNDAVAQVELAFFPASPEHGGTAHRRHELADQAGLTHARFALDQHYLGLGRPGFGRQLRQQGKLSLTPDEDQTGHARDCTGKAQCASRWRQGFDDRQLPHRKSRTYILGRPANTDVTEPPLRRSGFA